MHEMNPKHPIPGHILVKRVSLNLIYGLVIILLSLGLGMWGYRHFEHMSWINAYLNASMILSGMGPATELRTPGGMIFAGTYALFSGVVFLIVMGIIFAPVIHWFFVKFHMQEGK